MTVIQNKELKKNIFDMRLSQQDFCASPGQFVNVKCEGYTLRRPISVCECENGVLRLVYEVRGGGTDWLSKRRAGDTLDVLGPLGNGFDMSVKGRILLLCGGIGIAPMIETAKRCDCDAVAGFRSAQVEVLTDEMSRLCKKTYIATDDGSSGYHGNVCGLLKTLDLSVYSAVYACGPRVMLAAAAEIINIPYFVSMEERMGCGVGACLVCSCAKKGGGYARVCADGPVFNAKEVEWNV